MPRIYYAQFNNVAVTAAQDLFEVQPADDKPVELVACIISWRDSETNEQLTITVQRRTGAFTGGSGGSTPTVQKKATIDPTAGVVVEANNTTRATGGTQEILLAEGFPSQAGWAFFPLPGAEPTVIQAELLVIGLENAPGASTTFNGTIILRELP